MVQEILDIATFETGILLHNDQKLILDLVAHLEPAITRLKMGMEIRNPLLDKIKENYSDIFSVSSKCAKVLQRKLNVDVPESEIAYLAMHIGAAMESIKNSQDITYKVLVACASGIGSSRLLSTRIQKEFANIDVVDVISTISLTDEIKKRDVDFVISTVNYNGTDKNVVVVSPLLTEEDKNSIKYTMGQVKETRRSSINYVDSNEVLQFETKLENMMNYSQGIIEVLRNYGFYYGDIQTKKHAIDFACKILIKDEHKQLELRASLERREELGSTIVPESNIMLLHCRTNALTELHVKIIRLRDFMEIDKVKIKNILVLIAPVTIPNTHLEIMSYVSNSLIEDQQYIETVISGDEEKNYFELNRILEIFYRKKTLEF